jgi:hypothetical protein
MGVGVSLTFLTIRLKHRVESDPDAAAVLKVMVVVTLLWVAIKALVIGLGLLLLESITPVTPLTATLLWGAVLLRIGVRDLADTLRSFFERASMNDRPQELPAEESNATSCAWRAEASDPCAPCAEGRCSAWKLLLGLLVIALCFLLMATMLFCVGYFPFAQDGMNWQSALSALGQLLLMCAFLVGWTAFIHENSLVYRILYHTRHTPTRMAIIVDLVAVSLLLTAVFFSLTLCLALMR